MDRASVSLPTRLEGISALPVTGRRYRLVSSCEEDPDVVSARPSSCSGGMPNDRAAALQGRASGTRRSGPRVAALQAVIAEVDQTTLGWWQYPRLSSRGASSPSTSGFSDASAEHSPQAAEEARSRPRRRPPAVAQRRECAAPLPQPAGAEPRHYARRVISRWSHARAAAQWRLTVATESPSADAVSGTVSPEK